MDDLTEKQARQMEAWIDLDVICARWMGDPRSNQGIASYSRDWSAAGPLLEAIQSVSLASPLPAAEGFHEGHDWRVTVWSDPAGGCELFHVDAPTPQLAIARACAVLVARGINRDDLEVVR